MCWEAEAGGFGRKSGLYIEFQNSQGYLHSKTLSQNKRKAKQERKYINKRKSN